ncbi:MAG TPA: restriction endonuclease [Ilumatobacteraceae bacterium]|nr:restriction endonuclease [Ilumatobacteraceae bacterium]
MAKRHAEESQFLFSSTRFEWRDRIDGERFEGFVKEIIDLSPGVRWSAFAGLANEPDGGRDILVEWEMPLLPGELDAKDPDRTHRVCRIVVQCKADLRPVGVSRVTAILDTVEFHEAEGYLLVVRSRVTRPLADRLDRHRSKGRRFNWWTGDDLEERLRRYRHVVARYPDVLTAID